jgi:YidC/Oxa1 family membrane protein insertase
MFDTFIVNPMINALLLFYDLLGNNYVLAIAVFTIVIRLITLPLNIKQQKSMQKTQEMQPQIQALQKKYKDNPQRMQEEFKKIGYNPTESLTGCLPLLIQMPILFGLYRAIIVTLGSTPQSLFELTQSVYSFIDLTPLLPVANKFLWLNLGQPDPYFILPVLVFVTMWAQQKILTPQTKTDDKNKGKNDNPAAAMSKSMQTTMPLMFGFFSLSFPSGLSIYFVLANIIGIGQGYYTKYLTDKEKEEGKQKKTSLPPPSSADQAISESVAAETSAITGNSSSGTGKTSKPTAKDSKPRSKRKRKSARR